MASEKCMSFLFKESLICIFSVPSSPENVEIRSSGNSITLSWQKVQQPNGVVLGYNIYWKDDKRKIHGKITISDQRITKYLLANLSKYTTTILSMFTTM